VFRSAIAAFANFLDSAMSAGNNGLEDETGVDEAKAAISFWARMMSALDVASHALTNIVSVPDAAVSAVFAAMRV